jgi:adenylyltransferase/sulfurtransferase
MDARYSRQIALPGFGASAQDALEASRVLVIGAGGLGSSVIPSLAAAGVGTIGVIDDDTVETSNLHRQLMHTPADVGRSKTHSAAETVAALNPATRVIALDARLSAATSLELFADFDVVVDGSDNFPTRYLANDAAALTGIPLVWGSVSQYGGQVGVAWAARGPHYRDLFPVAPPPGSVLSCEVGGVLPTIVATVGSIMATEVIKIVTGVGTPLIGRVTVVDALMGGFRELSYAADPTAAPITELIDYEAFCGIAPSDSAFALTPRQLATMSPDAITLLDVREPWEAAIASLPGSVLMPLASLDASALDRSKPVVLYCHHGIRSAAAREALARAGLDASHLTGGIDAWARELDPTMARY